MKLSLVNFIASNISRKILNEGYSRRYDFDYTGDEVTDPRPAAVSLGRWRSPRGNQLFAGLNLNYLSDEQITRLQQHLPGILQDRNLKRRVRKLRSLAPDIFNSAYRTYKRDEMHQIDPGVLRFMKIPETPPEGAPEEPEKAPPGPRPSLADKIMARHRQPEEKPEEVPRKTAPAKPEKPEKPTRLGEPEEDEEEVEDIAPEEEETL